MTQETKTKQTYKGMATISIFVVIILILFLIVRLLFLDVREIHGTSMLPSYSEGQKVVVLRNVLGNTYHRDDVIMFSSPDTEDEFYIKRIVGVAGDEIAMMMDYVFVNGHVLDDENYLTGSHSEDMTLRTWKVGTDEVFVMGDNRLPGGSYDSREYGPINLSQIYGRIIK